MGAIQHQEVRNTIQFTLYMSIYTKYATNSVDYVNACNVSRSLTYLQVPKPQRSFRHGTHLPETDLVGVIVGMQVMVFGFTSEGEEIRLAKMFNKPFLDLSLAEVALYIQNTQTNSVNPGACNASRSLTYLQVPRLAAGLQTWDTLSEDCLGGNIKVTQAMLFNFSCLGGEMRNCSNLIVPFVAFC